MIGEPARAEDLFPAAAELFRHQGRAPSPGTVRWFAGLVAVGVALLIGRAVVEWMNRNL